MALSTRTSSESFLSAGHLLIHNITFKYMEGCEKREIHLSALFLSIHWECCLIQDWSTDWNIGWFLHWSLKCGYQTLVTKMMQHKEDILQLDEKPCCLKWHQRTETFILSDHKLSQLSFSAWWSLCIEAFSEVWVIQNSSFIFYDKKIIRWAEQRTWTHTSHPNRQSIRSLKKNIFISAQIRQTLRQYW